MKIGTIIYTTLKLTLVGVLAGFAGYLFNLDYLLTGVLGILSISPTKKDSLKLGIKRYFDVIFALSLAVVCFLVFGFEIYVYLIFLSLFIFGSFILKIEIGLVPGIVLVNHMYLHGHVDFHFFLQEILIISLSVGVALVINTFYPEPWLSKMTLQLKSIDSMIQDHLFMLSIILSRGAGSDDFKKHFEVMSHRIIQKIEDAELEDKNRIFSNDLAYVAYLYMRRNQVYYVNHMYESAFRLNEGHEHQRLMSSYIEQLSFDISDQNKAITQMKKLEELTSNFKTQPLPKTRNEFELRAMLYHMLTDLKSMLEVKMLFHKRYPHFKL